MAHLVWPVMKLPGSTLIPCKNQMAPARTKRLATIFSVILIIPPRARTSEQRPAPAIAARTAVHITGRAIWILQDDRSENLGCSQRIPVSGNFDRCRNRTCGNPDFRGTSDCILVTRLRCTKVAAASTPYSMVTRGLSCRAISSLLPRQQSLRLRIAKLSRQRDLSSFRAPRRPIPRQVKSREPRFRSRHGNA